MDISTTLIKTLKSRHFRIDALHPSSSDSYQLLAYNIKALQNVSLFVRLFSTLDSLRSHRELIESSVRVVSPKVVKFYRVFDYKIDTNLWVLVTEYEYISCSLTDEIRRRRISKAPWKASELFQFLSDFLITLSDAQHHTIFHLRLTTDTVYLCNKDLKLSADDWSCEQHRSDSGCPYRATVWALGVILLQMAALREGDSFEEGMHAVVSALQYPKWLKYYILVMVRRVESLRPDLNSLLRMISTSSTENRGGCGHLEGDAEGGEGCVVCGKFFCPRCEGQRDICICTQCSVEKETNPRLVSLARTPDGTSYCDGCHAILGSDEVISMNDEIAGTFCFNCLQSRFDDHDKASECRKSVFSLLYYSIQQSL